MTPHSSQKESPVPEHRMTWDATQRLLRDLPLAVAGRISSRSHGGEFPGDPQRPLIGGFRLLSAAVGYQHVHFGPIRRGWGCAIGQRLIDSQHSGPTQRQISGVERSLGLLGNWAGEFCPQLRHDRRWSDRFQISDDRDGVLAQPFVDQFASQANIGFDQQHQVARPIPLAQFLGRIPGFPPATFPHQGENRSGAWVIQKLAEIIHGWQAESMPTRPVRQAECGEAPFYKKRTQPRPVASPSY